jgi:hypothetical protein
MDQSTVVQLERYNPAAALEMVQEDVEGEEIGSFQHDDDGSIHEEEGEYRYGALMSVMDSKEKADQKHITVVYRYTHFTAASDTGTTVHRLRFVVPPAGDMARSLRWVGASSLVYPGARARTHTRRPPILLVALASADRAQTLAGSHERRGALPCLWLHG